MDELDLKILRVLLQGDPSFHLDPEFRRSYRALARQLGVNEGTVRNRAHRMEELGGFIKEWRIIVNPRLWDGGEAALILDVPRAVPRAELVAKLRLLPGMHVVNTYVGRMVSVLFVYDDEDSLPRTGELIQKMSEAERLTGGLLPYPPCGIALTRTDWRLLRCLDEAPRKPLSTIAEELELSSRTARRRLHNIIEAGAAFALPTLDPSGLEGAVMAVLEVIHPPERRGEISDQVARHWNSWLWYVLPLTPFASANAAPIAYHLMLPNVSVAQEVLEMTLSLAGVETARIDFFEEMLFLPETFSRILERGSEGSPLVPSGS